MQKGSITTKCIKRLAKFLNFSQRKVLAQSFVLSNFNYCPFIWHLCLTNDLHRMEQIQERTLRFVHTDYASSYAALLQKSTLELGRVRSICTDIKYYCLTKISIRAKRSISRVFSLLIVPSPFFVHCPYKGRINRAESVLTGLKPY